MQYEDGDNQSHRQSALIVDRSLSGAGMILSKAIPPGTRILIEAAAEKITAVVKHCHYSEGGYLVGVEYEGFEDSGWNQRGSRL